MKEIAFTTVPTLEHQKLLRSLSELRKRCLQATRCGDFRRVAQLTVETAQVNAQLQQNGINAG